LADGGVALGGRSLGQLADSRISFSRRSFGHLGGVLLEGGAHLGTQRGHYTLEG
jgi:hypothetical protein